MQPKIYWIDNLRGIACLMVVMIHTTTWYVTNAHSVSPVTWDIANVLNSASRVSVPLFFMISGYLFFGERSAQPRHFLRIGLCLLFYSAIALLYIALFTSINMELALKNLLQKPVFYHLWFFFAIAVIYLVSPLIQVKNVGGKMLLVLMVVIGIIANPNTVPQKIDGFEWLPINLYINGDTFYYILYGMLGRFMQMVVEHKHKIGFQGTLLIEPKPQEPTKHQYDYDAATVYGFLKQFGLEKEIKLNIEANHATLAGHSFHHEIATAIALGLFGSVDANRGDAQLGWDTDQFPNSVEENALVMYEILKAGGFTTGGLNFDAKVRRQSTDKYDLFYGHIGAMDTMALALKIAARMIEDGELDKRIAQRYSGWNSELGQQILKGQMSLADLAKYAQEHNLSPVHQSGRQEQLENLVNHYLFDK